MQLSPKPINMDGPGSGESCWDTWARALTLLKECQEEGNRMRYVDSVQADIAWSRCGQLRMAITNVEAHILANNTHTH